MGTAHFWNQTIDTVLAIQLIVGIGLAVDYSAHIGHCFMTNTGTKNGPCYCVLLISNKSRGHVQLSTLSKTAKLHKKTTDILSPSSTVLTVIFCRYTERVVKTMREMGAAVFYGGFSTFLAFILLSASKSYIFRTFFKVGLPLLISDSAIKAFSRRNSNFSIR